MDQDSQTKTYPLINKGVFTKLDPALLSDGQMFSSVNTASPVDGEITSRPGKLLVGHLPDTATAPHKICKLTIPAQVVPISSASNATPIVIGTAIPHGWQTGFLLNLQGITGNTAANGQGRSITVLSPSSFSINGSAGNAAYINGGTATLAFGDPSLRYVGVGGDIWRTNNFYAAGSFTKINPVNVMNGFNPLVTGWAMTPYSAGATGNPLAYFATLAGMFKDQGNAPFATLESWGITQALAACSGVNAPQTPMTITNVQANGTLIQITVSAPETIANGQTVVIVDVLGTVEANSTFSVTVIDSQNFTLNNSTFVNAYISGGSLYLAGPDSTQPGADPYDYVVTLRDTATGDEGNPSAFMDSTLAVSSQNGSITVTMWGSPDAKITGTQSLVLYRRGGSYDDSLFREVGFAVNPGVDGSGVPLSVTFVDTTPDIGLLFADTAEFDNFPPVVSSLRVPVNTTIASGNPGLAPGWNILTLGASIQNILTVGSSLVIGSSSGSAASNQETVVIAALPQPGASGANTTILVYLQLNHAVGEPVEIGSVAGQPCSIVTSAFDTLFVAGDPNNPQTLYQSKTGRPQAFPIIDSLGNSHSMNVGTPSNGIQNITEFRGKILCMNVSNLFEVDVFQGVMYGPNETPCERGLLAPWAWCKSENVVYYLAYDGIWSWDGSQSRKVSQQIDTVFQAGPALSPGGAFGFPPINQALISQSRMEYYYNQLFFLYAPYGEGSTNSAILRYDTLYTRWQQESHLPFSVNSQYISTMFFEQDISAFIFARSDPAGGVFSQYNPPSSTTIGYSDEYTDVDEGLNGEPFPCSFQPGFYRPEDFTRVKMFQDFLIELFANQLGDFDIPISVELFYDYSSTPDVLDEFSVNSQFPARRVFALPLQLSGTPALPAGKEAFSVSPLISWTSTIRASFTSIGFRYIDRDAVQAGMASDWMNLGSNNDKRLYQIHLEHNTGGSTVKLHMDIRYGINGVQEADNVAIFQIQSSDKTTVTLPIPETNFPNNLTICKSIRLRPEYQDAEGGPATQPEISVGSLFRIFYKPTFDFETYPADQVLFTPWKDFGYPCEKIAKVLNLDIDTGGVPASIQAQTDGANIGLPFIVTTTTNDRKRNLPFASMPVQPIGKMWRLTELPGLNGKAQLFEWSIDFQKEPCQITFFDTFEISFGYDGYKLIKQAWIDYASAVPVIFTLIADNGNVLFVINLPAQANRDVVRFYLPESNAPILGSVTVNGQVVTWVSGQQFDLGWSGRSILINGAAYKVMAVASTTSLTVTVSAGVQAIGVLFGIFTVGTVFALNKSIKYRVQVQSTTIVGFKLYLETSRLEWCPIGAEQRRAYQQMRLSEVTKFTP